MMRTAAWLGFFAAVGCDKPAEEEPAPSREVAAVAVCEELATIVCESDALCCPAEAPSDAGPPAGEPDSGTSDAGDGGTSSDAATDAVSTAESGAPTDAAAVADTGATGPAPTTCVATQLKKCRATLAPLLEDPRLAYVPQRGGALLDHLRGRAEKCWATPVRYDDVAGLFDGTGAQGADCTPPSTKSTDIQAASLSCSAQAACRLYLTSDGSREGICEARTAENVDACSHAFDCGTGRFCKLPNDWKPGLWGRCQPLRTDGWQCIDDRECESGFCNDAARCARREKDRVCLALGYQRAVLADAPIAYLRLGERTGTVAVDASGSGHSGAYVGKVKYAAASVLAGDSDLAIELAEPNAYLTVAVGEQLAAATALSLEVWVASENTSGPIFELRGMRTSLRVARTGEKGDVLRAGFVDATGKLREIASPAGAIDSAFHHVAVTHDGTTAKLYLDGVEVGAVTTPLLVDRADVLYVGHQPAVDPAPAATLRGRLDEVAIYTVALGPKHFARRREAAARGVASQTFPLFSVLE